MILFTRCIPDLRTDRGGAGVRSCYASLKGVDEISRNKIFGEGACSLLITPTSAFTHKKNKDEGFKHLFTLTIKVSQKIVEITARFRWRLYPPLLTSCLLFIAECGSCSAAAPPSPEPGMEYFWKYGNGAHKVRGTALLLSLHARSICTQLYIQCRGKYDTQACAILSKRF